MASVLVYEGEDALLEAIRETSGNRSTIEAGQNPDSMDRGMVVVIGFPKAESPSGNSDTEGTRQENGHLVDDEHMASPMIDTRDPFSSYAQRNDSPRCNTLTRQTSEQDYDATPNPADEDSSFENTILSRLGDFLMAHDLQEDLLWALHI
ncbi:hypothetical protein BST61_g4946 [Cercospora zeina]